MLISGAITRNLEEIAARESDVMRSYTPGALPQFDDAAQASGTNPSLDPLCAAPPPDAYFVTSANGKLTFTRDGSFSIRDGAIVDSQGDAVVGYAAPNSVAAPLRVDAADYALGFAQSAHIGVDGTIAYERTTIDPRTGGSSVQTITAGRVALARFAAGTRLQPADAGRVTAPPGVLPHLGTGGDGNFGELQPFARERSGIDIDRGLDLLQEAYIALDAVRAAAVVRAGTEKTAMDLLK